MVVIALFSAKVESSLPARGAWIEIIRDLSSSDAANPSLPARGAWIEISVVMNILIIIGRSPHGERGMKFLCQNSGRRERETSLPARGAWIEMIRGYAVRRERGVAPRTGSVD